MSKRINVNPDHYKTKGRERPGDDVLAEREKLAFSRTGAKTDSRKAHPATKPRKRTAKQK